MLAGQPPFTGPTVESLVHQHLSAQPPEITAIRPSVPGWVAAALERSLAKTPADRFNPVAQFGEAISQRVSATVTPGGGITQIPTAPVPDSRRRGLWIRWPLLVAGLSAVVAIALLLTRDRIPEVVLGHAVQVTSEDGLEIHPAISPDGNLVAYAAGPVRRDACLRSTRRWRADSPADRRHDYEPEEPPVVSGRNPDSVSVELLRSDSVHSGRCGTNGRARGPGIGGDICGLVAGRKPDRFRAWRLAAGRYTRGWRRVDRGAHSP